MLIHLLAVGLSLAPLATAQRPRAVCSTDDQYRWTFNSLGQSPCEVAGDLLDVCLGRNVYIVALDPGQSYPPAQASGEGNDCRCSTIYYSMLSACAYCQGRSWIAWDQQTIPNCVATFDRHFPISIPGVRVPSWANLDIIASVNRLVEFIPSSYISCQAQGAFDPNRARDSVNPPTSSTRRPPPPPDPTTKPRSDPTRTPRPDPTPDPTSADADPTTSNFTSSRTSNSRTTTANDDTTRTLPGQSTSTRTVTDSSTPPPPDSTSQTSLDDDAVADTQFEKKKPPIGAIVGGVGGGILFVAILCSIYVFFCMRRRRRSEHSTSEIVPSTAVSPFFDNPSYRDGRSMSPPMSNQLTGNAMSIKSTSQSNVFNPFIDGSERMTERTTSPSRLSVQYTNSISDPSNHASSDRSIVKGHQPSPSFATTLPNSNSNWNSTSSPSYHNHPEHQPQHVPHVNTSSSMPFRPVRRPPADDLESMRTSTRLSRAGYLPPPYDPSTAPPMPLGDGKA